MSQTLYIKRGRRYFPVREHSSEVYDSLPFGQYVITVTAGSMRLRRVDTPATDEVLAAVERLRSAMEDAMHEANTSKFTFPAPLTPEQQAAADKLRKLLGSSLVTYTGASMSDVVDAGVNTLLRQLNEED